MLQSLLFIFSVLSSLQLHKTAWSSGQSNASRNLCSHTEVIHTIWRWSSIRYSLCLMQQQSFFVCRHVLILTLSGMEAASCKSRSFSYSTKSSFLVIYIYMFICKLHNFDQVGLWIRLSCFSFLRMSSIFSLYHNWAIKTWGIKYY